MDRCRIAYEDIIATATETYDDYDGTIRQSFFGSATDPIAGGLLPSEVNSDDFTVMFDLPGVTGEVLVDSVSVEIFYAVSMGIDATEGISQPSPYAAGCINGETLVLVGLNGLIAVSTDASQTWRRVESGTSKTLRGVSYSQASGYIAVGDSGVVLVSQDAETWSRKDTIDGDSFTAIDKQAKTIVGGDSVYYRIGNLWNNGRKA